MLSRSAAVCYQRVLLRLSSRGDHQLAATCRGVVSSSSAGRDVKEEEKKKTKKKRDVEAGRDEQSFAALLRRAADAIESGKSFRVSVKGKRLSVPRGAELSVEHEEHGDGKNELEFQLKWTGK